MSDWNPSQYLKFQKERTQPAADLAARIEIDNPKNIIDIGCGPGNSTRVLKKRFPNARVIGADFSLNMIKKAEKDNPDIEFMQFDASKDFESLDEKFDVIFSNACIQWVPDHKKLLKNMMGALNNGGVMAIQVPYQADMPINTIIESVTHSDKWKNEFSVSRMFYNLDEQGYFDLLCDISSDFSMWKTFYFHRLESCRSIIEWYSSTGLRLYLDALDGDPEKTEEFKKDILAEVEKYYPLSKNGEVIFRFSRLFFTAVK